MGWARAPIVGQRRRARVDDAREQAASIEAQQGLLRARRLGNRGRIQELERDLREIRVVGAAVWKRSGRAPDDAQAS